MAQNNQLLKSQVKAFWEAETCDTRYGVSADRKQYFDEIEQTRYTLEPYIPGFAGFAESAGKRILEIGVGAGTDFCQWVRNGAIVAGIDLTIAAIELTHERLQVNNLQSAKSSLCVADVENLPFKEETFDLVYSWGVLHHTPNTEVAFREVFRVLGHGSVLKAMVYHVPSWTGWMLWVWYGLLRGQPNITVRKVIFDHLESIGTKAYTVPEAKKMLNEVGFSEIQLATRLGPTDLLEIMPSGKYQSALSRLIWKFYPRWLIRILGGRFGLALLINASKGFH